MRPLWSTAGPRRTRVRVMQSLLRARDRAWNAGLTPWADPHFPSVNGRMAQPDAVNRPAARFFNLTVQSS